MKRPIIYMRHGRWTWRFPGRAKQLLASHCEAASVWCVRQNDKEGR